MACPPPAKGQNRDRSLLPRRPTWVRSRLVSPLFRVLVLRGGQDVMRVLRVQGRISGRSYDVPVRIATRDGQRYVLSMLGEAQPVPQPAGGLRGATAIGPAGRPCRRPRAPRPGEGGRPHLVLPAPGLPAPRSHRAQGGHREPDTGRGRPAGPPG